MKRPAISPTVPKMFRICCLLGALGGIVWYGIAGMHDRIITFSEADISSAYHALPLTNKDGDFHITAISVDMTKRLAVTVQGEGDVFGQDLVVDGTLHPNVTYNSYTNAIVLSTFAAYLDGIRIGPLVKEVPPPASPPKKQKGKKRTRTAIPEERTAPAAPLRIRPSHRRYADSTTKMFATSEVNRLVSRVTIFTLNTRNTARAHLMELKSYSVDQGMLNARMSYWQAEPTLGWVLSGSGIMFLLSVFGTWLFRPFFRIIRPEERGEDESEVTHGAERYQPCMVRRLEPTVAVEAWDDMIRPRIILPELSSMEDGSLYQLGSISVTFTADASSADFSKFAAFCEDNALTITHYLHAFSSVVVASPYCTERTAIDMVSTLPYVERADLLIAPDLKKERSS